MPCSRSERWHNRETGGHCAWDVEERDDEGQPGEEGKEAGQEVLLSLLGTNGGREGVNTAFFFTSSHSFDTSPTWPDIVNS